MKNFKIQERSEPNQGISGDRQERVVSPFENVTFVNDEDRNAEVAQSEDRHLRQISCLSQYLNEIGQIPRLSVSEEQLVAREVRSGSEEARERMINGNLRLVVKIAHDFEGYGMPVSDLINEGNIGLMKAFINPILPSLMRSETGIPYPSKSWAIFTTKRRLPLIIRSLASSLPDLTSRATSCSSLTERRGI